jgi:serine phosphatase RsbU (regulator of sigma subunit)/predicted ester cyclase
LRATPDTASGYDGYDGFIARLGRRERTRAVSTEEDNKAMVRRFYEAQTKGDLDTLRELLAPSILDHSLRPGQESGREGFLQAVAEDHATYSDVQYVIVEQMAAEGGRVVSRLRLRGSHDRGPSMGFAPTGKVYEDTAIVIHRISEGKIVEEWREGSGLAELTQQHLGQERIEHERLDQELEVARDIQLGSLPEGVPTLEEWQIDPYCQPAREVGGDFYEFYQLGDGRVGFVVGDATGKGVPAAIVTTATAAYLGAVAAASDSSPGEALALANEALFARIPPNMFVTCFYCILDLSSARLRYANAGHDLPYVWHGGDAEELRARGMPLGLMPRMGYKEKEVVLDAGDSAFFYSDGLVEAHDSQREMFGFPRLKALVAKHGDEEGALGSILLEELYSFVGEGWEQEDDITLLTLRRSASLS